MGLKFNPFLGNLDFTGDGAGGTWGSITGTLSSQTDLQSALDAKQRNTLFNILDYGAVGDGATDNSTAVQNAINAAEVSGGCVFVPEGTFMSVMPTISTGNITIMGTGWKSVLLLAPSSIESGGLTIGLWVNGASNVIIKDLAIDGNYANIAKNGTYQSASSLWTPVITEYGSTSVKVYKMAGSGTDATTYLKQRMPIRITDSSNVLVENCLITNSVSAGILADSASVGGCTDINIINNRIYLTWDNGIYFHQGVNYGTAVGNDISDTTYNGVSTVYCNHIIIANNNIRNAGPSDSDSGGIQVNGSNNCDVTGNIIDNCQFYGIDLLSTQETNITGGDGGNSVWANNTVVSTNSITNCHANDYPSHNAPGINNFGSNSANISSNSIDNCDFGISAGGHAVNTLISTNRISNCSSIGINIGNSADVINITVKGNYVAYNGSHGVFAYAPARYENNSFIGNTGMGLSLASPPTGLPGKIDYVIGNTILDNTDSGILTNGGATSTAIIERNTFGNSYGVLFNDGEITYASTTLVSQNANFVSSDVGLPVFLINQGQYDTLTTTTIASVTDEHTVVLNDAAGATQTGLLFFIGRGVAFFTGSTSGSTLTAPSGTFKSSDSGLLVTVMSTDPTPTMIFQGTVSSYSSSTSVALSGTIGTYSAVAFFINRSQGQQSRSVNNYNDYPVIIKNNSTFGTPEYLGGGGTINILTKVLQNVRDPLSAQDVATKNYVDTNAYTLPTASTSVLGGVKVDGTSITIASGVISSSGGGGSGATTALDNLASVAINTGLVLGTSDGGALGSTTKMWSDLFLASGGVINFNNGDVTLTHSSGQLALAGNLLLSAKNIITDTTTGMKIGTATTQKLGFFNATPIVQVSATTDLGTVLSNLGLRASGTAYPITTSGVATLSGGITSSGGNILLNQANNSQEFKVGGSTNGGMVWVRKNFDRVGFGIDGTSATVDNPFDVNLDAKFRTVVAIGDAGISSGKILNIDKTITDSSGDKYGFFAVLRANEGASSSQNFFGGFIQAQTLSGNAQNYTSALFGAQLFSQHNGTGTVSKMYGIEAKISNTSTGTITTGVAIHIPNAAIGGGAITTAYGLLIEDQTAGSTIYAIKTGLGIVSLGDVFFPVQAVTASAPTYVLGGIYFDTTLNKLRIGGASGWESITSV